MMAVQPVIRIAAGRPIAKVAAQRRCETRCVAEKAVCASSLAGNNWCNIIGLAAADNIHKSAILSSFPPCPQQHGPAT